MVHGNLRETKAAGKGPLARKLAALRANAHWSYGELEAHSGINRAKLQRLEKGVIRYPTTATLNRIADTYGVDRSVLHDVAASGHSGPLPSLSHYLRRTYGLNSEQVARVERYIDRLSQDQLRATKQAAA